MSQKNCRKLPNLLDFTCYTSAALRWSWEWRFRDSTRTLGDIRRIHGSSFNSFVLEQITSKSPMVVARWWFQPVPYESQWAPIIPVLWLKKLQIWTRPPSVHIFGSRIYQSCPRRHAKFKLFIAKISKLPDSDLWAKLQGSPAEIWWLGPNVPVRPAIWGNQTEISNWWWNIYMGIYIYTHTRYIIYIPSSDPFDVHKISACVTLNPHADDKSYTW